jgi:hypothetical protein
MTTATRKSPGYSRGRFSLTSQYGLASARSRQPRITLEEAKDRLTISSLWARLDLPGKPGTSCCSPFREDRKPSFSVYNNSRNWKDHATGESGDAADFLAHALNVSPEEGCRKLIEFAGGHRIHSPAPRPIHPTAARSEKAAKRAGWPPFAKPTRAEISAIANLRGLSVAGVSLAAERGLLFCYNSAEGRAWVLTDSSRLNGQERLLSGQTWAAGMKARTLPGSEADWPIGLPEAQNFGSVALVEGGPDLLAAFHGTTIRGAQRLIAPVAMLGASLRIPNKALTLFAGKRVRLFPHADKAGQNAVALWAAELGQCALKVDGFSFDGLTRNDGEPVNDLNDFFKVDYDQWESFRGVIDSAFRFAGKEGC